MKQHLFACVTALLVMLLFSQCDRGPNPPLKGDIPFDTANARKHVILIKDGRILTHSFDSSRRYLTGLVKDSGKQDLNKILRLPDEESFNRDIFALLLNQKDSKGAVAQGIRIYLGRDESGEVRLILVPVDAEGKNILNQMLPDEKGEVKAVSIPGVSSATAAPPAGKEEGGEKGGHCSGCPL